MFKKNKKIENSTGDLQGNPEFEFSEKQDFEFVQLDKSIHDTKFETKPTTYFKDAFKRFSKSKSAVSAACILGVLILMAVFVPIIDGNSITLANMEATYLPPKWFENAGGFMDGTGYVEDVVLDPSTDKPVTDANGSTIYYTEAIIGDIEEEDSYFSDTLNPNILTYGRGGYVAWTFSGTVLEADFVSPQLSFSNGDDIVITYVSDGTELENEDFVFEAVMATGSGDTYDEDVLPFSAVPGSETTFTTNWQATSSTVGNILFHIENDEIWMDSLSITRNGNEIMLADVNSNMVVPAGISTPSEFIFNTLVDTNNTVPDNSVWTATGGTWAIKDIRVTTGSFRYDYYAGAYGEDVATYADSDIQEFINRGYIEPTFAWTNNDPVNMSWDITDEDVGFKLTALGEEECPLRSVTVETSENFRGNWSRSITGVRSKYRDFYYKGYIAECKPVYFLMGTNNNGVDFFKLLFSGLLTSLELGVLTSVINIVIGVIWGSISGYFGGTVDLLMERFTEILGGMPWIVMMTLIVLLMGSNFWTFLLALCLTGWMGTAGTTRAQFYRFKNREYVLAARTLGASDSRLIFRHILPNGIGTIITGAALMIPSVIFQEATISYLLPNVLSFQGTSFGVTLSNAQGYIYTAPYMIICGSIVMAIIMICFNLFGNGLRDAFNPSLKGGHE